MAFMGAFSYIILKRLFLLCGLPFRTDFSPANWEIIREVLEVVTKALFDDDTLCTKHKKCINLMQFDRALGKGQPFTFAPGVQDKFDQGMSIEAWHPPHTQHAYYIDRRIYIEIYDETRIHADIAQHDSGGISNGARTSDSIHCFT